MMFNILTITLAIACLNFVPSYGAKDCSIRVRGDMSIPTPLILDPETYQMVIPNKRSNVIVGAGQSVKLWCSDSFTDSNKNLLTAKCISGIKFNIDGQSKNFNSLTCKSWQTVSAEPARKNCTDGEILDLGFRIDSHHFAKQMEICFDPLQEVTHYVQYRLGPYSKYYQTKVDRPGFEQLDYFGNKNVDNLYTKKKQMATFKKSLNMDVSKVYYGGSNSFLARGHIAAKADFVYGATECGTFVFLNVAPQWQSINAGNWNDIEELVRELANKRGTHFTVYSGVHGVTTLANNKGKQIPLYLYVDKNNNGQIPVPMLYYRVIIEESSKLGVVLITLNNPHLTKAQIQNEYTLCKDISNELSYFDIKHKTDLSLGYSYACTVPDFLKTVHNLPEIDVRGLLA